MEKRKKKKKKKKSYWRILKPSPQETWI